MRRLVQLMAAVALLLAGAQAVLADGGVTFNNISAGDGAGVTYRRATSPDREAVHDAAILAGPIPIPMMPNFVRDSAQKWHGAPGVAIFDYDRDGDQDIYVTNGPGADNSLYANRFIPDGVVTFVDVGAAAGVGLPDHDSSGVCYGDVDNDGDKDLYVVGSGYSNHLFRNDGNGTFTDITAASGTAGPSHFYYAGCTMGDVDNDGRLDIALATTYHPWLHRQPVFVSGYIPGTEADILFVNQGGNVFTDASASSGFLDLLGLAPNGETVTWANAFVDIDQDGDVDYMGAEDAGPTNVDRGLLRLLKNDGTGQFTDETYNLGLNVNGGFMGYSYADLNCDGHLDFFVTDTGSYLTPTRPSRWYLQNPDGSFTNPGLGGLGGLPFGWGTSAFDYDNDADSDIVFHGGVDMLRNIIADNPGIILQNSGSCSATMVYDAAAVPFDHRPRVVEGMAIGDLNNDGFDDIVSVSELDIVPGNFFTFVPFASPIPRSPIFDPISAFEVGFFPLTPAGLEWIDPTLVDGTLAVELNSGGNGNGSAQITLLGSRGLVANPHATGRVNRDGIGGVIRFTPAGGKTSIRPVLGGASYASQDSLTATMGLGTTATGTVEVLWPGGVRNRLYDVAAGEQVTLPEIPCDFATFASGLPANANAAAHRNKYGKCVKESLKDLVKKGAVTQALANRVVASALRAYDETNCAAPPRPPRAPARGGPFARAERTTRWRPCCAIYGWPHAISARPAGSPARPSSASPSAWGRGAPSSASSTPSCSSPCRSPSRSGS